jgi:hypothetical protein
MLWVPLEKFFTRYPGIIDPTRLVMLNGDLEFLFDRGHDCAQLNKI